MYFEQIPKETFKRFLFWGFIFFLILLFLGAPTERFPVHSRIHIENGETLKNLSLQLKKNGIVSSSTLLQAFVILFSGENGAKSGEYVFEKRIHTIIVAWRIAHAEYNIDRVKVTIPEGVQNQEIGAILKETIPGFLKENFLLLAHDKEGFLFPDTYLFFTNTSPESIISVMENTFKEKIKPYTEEIKASGHTLGQVVTMASIIEKEARGDIDQKLVSGILWKRISLGIPLQVDATFLYINGKGTAELTLDDLAIDSPYNTYKYRGLPPGPIGNPGLHSIEAALRPTKSAYLFYLSDKEGTMHYAKEFEEHKRNKALYLSR